MKRPIANIAFILIALALSLYGCQDATLSPYPSPDIRPIELKVVPLGVGNYWQYRVEYLDELGKPAFTDNLTTSIVGAYNQTELNEKVKFYLYSEKYDNNSRPFKSGGLMFEKNDALFSSYNIDNPRNRNEMVMALQYPLTAGKEWATPLFDKIPGMEPIRDSRKVDRKIDTVINGNEYSNCFVVSRKWIYSSARQADTVYLGYDIYYPKLGCIYQAFYINDVLIERRIIQDYVITLSN
jgi:hypothetical protein